MTLLSKLNISHSVILDRDENTSYHLVINEFIRKNKNTLTKEIFFFDKDLEAFLEIESAKRPDLKPIHIVNCYKQGKIGEKKIDDIIKILKKLI